MRSLNRNKTKIIALNYIGKEMILDTSGNMTGEYNIKYSDEIEFEAHISGAKGNSTIEIFGSNISYDKTILLSLKLFNELCLNENSVFFIDKEPIYVENIPMYDYKVVRISKTLNEVVIAVSQVRDEN